ncbi:hypothetical protein F5J12DRAFT_786267, partial [Pisolithus orientalis]|uniref:uncharacterized protein n=1 Tax=Pisolithus orientalis TaxID=936130 RepID=UPI0022257956
MASTLTSHTRTLPFFSVYCTLFSVPYYSQSPFIQKEGLIQKTGMSSYFPASLYHSQNTPLPCLSKKKRRPSTTHRTPPRHALSKKQKNTPSPCSSKKKNTPSLCLIQKKEHLLAMPHPKKEHPLAVPYQKTKEHPLAMLIQKKKITPSPCSSKKKEHPLTTPHPKKRPPPRHAHPKKK